MPNRIQFEIDETQVVSLSFEEPRKLSGDEALAESLNPGTNWSFRTKNGAVRFNYRMLDGCCGICLIHGVVFGSFRDRKEFYKELNEYLMSGEKSGNMNRGALMMTDAVGGEHGGNKNIYTFCTESGWNEVQRTFNPRSGRYVATFMIPRKVYGSDASYSEPA